MQNDNFNNQTNPIPSSGQSGSSDPGNREQTNAHMASTFRTAALNVTQLYRDAQVQQRRAYKQGYEQCLRELVTFVNDQLQIQYESQQYGPTASSNFIPISELETFTASKLNQIKNYQEGSLNQDPGNSNQMD